MSYSPESSWVIQDLDMMYPPQERNQVFPQVVKSEPTMDSCSYGTPDPITVAGNRSQSCALAPQCPTTNNYPSALHQSYGNVADIFPTNQNSEWPSDLPSDLENIILDSNLPTESDSPLQLEDYTVERFVYVNPSTLDSTTATTNPVSNYHNPACSTTKYSNPQCMQPFDNKIGEQVPQYFDRLPPPTNMGTIEPDMTSSQCIPSSQGQGRGLGRRGRPRAEWRITNAKKKGCVGRPRTKPACVGRPAINIKTEIPEDEFDDSLYMEPGEEKKERRREQNRRAARKLREKKKVHVETMKKDYQHIIQDNRRLTCEVKQLREQIQQLQHAKASHVCMCRDSFTPSPSSSTSTSQSGTTGYITTTDALRASVVSSQLGTDLTMER